MPRIVLGTAGRVQQHLRRHGGRRFRARRWCAHDGLQPLRSGRVGGWVWHADRRWRRCGGCDHVCCLRCLGRQFHHDCWGRSRCSGYTRYQSRGRRRPCGGYRISGLAAGNSTPELEPRVCMYPPHGRTHTSRAHGEGRWRVRVCHTCALDRLRVR